MTAIDDRLARLLERPKRSHASAARVQAMRERRAAKGIKRIGFFCDPVTLAALRELRQQHPDKTLDAVICGAIQDAAAKVDKAVPVESLAAFRAAVVERWGAGLRGYAAILGVLTNAGFRNRNGNHYTRQAVKDALASAGLI